MKKLFKAVGTSLLVMVFMALAGCDQARGKFDQVKIGMTRAEAVQLLGEPQEKELTSLGTEIGEVLRWRLGKKTLVLQISKDKDRVTGRQLTAAEKKNG